MEKLIRGPVDIGLVPVAILPELNEFHLLTDYCIGANGNVESVVLVQQVPLEEIKRWCWIISREHLSSLPEFWQKTSGTSNLNGYKRQGYEDHLERYGRSDRLGRSRAAQTWSSSSTFMICRVNGKKFRTSWFFACWVSNKIIPGSNFIFRLNASKKNSEYSGSFLDHLVQEKYQQLKHRIIFSM